MPLYKVLLHLLSLLVLFSGELKPENTNNIICNDILKLSPSLNLEHCNTIGEIINKYSNEYSIDYKIVLAIFKVESNFNEKAVNYASCDFGIGQINSLNMIHYKIDLGKHMTNLDYAIHNTYVILKETKVKYFKREKDWFTRYHSYTEKYRRIYYDKLKPHLERLDYGKAK